MKKLTLFIAFSFIALFAKPAEAIILYENYSLNQNPQFGAGFTISTPIASNPFVNDDLDQGTSFFVNTSAKLGRFEVSVALVEGVDELDLFLMSDSSGSPGSVIESFNVLNQMSTFQVYDPEDLPIISVNSQLRPTLSTSTRYWMIASVPGAETSAAWYQIRNDGGGFRNAFRENLGPWTVIPNDRFTTTLRVFDANDPSVIPEPATMALFGTGLFGAFVRRRRK